MIRRSTLLDRKWIKAVSGEVYRDLGDYGTIIPAWLDHPGVLGYVEEHEARQPRPRGFILLGFYEPEVGESASAYVADLLAIAVEPRFQRRGIGRALLRYAIHLAELANHNNTVSEIRLTVSDGNDVGRRLYASTGFRVLDEDHGSYNGGQRAIRMARPL